MVNDVFCFSEQKNSKFVKMLKITFTFINTFNVSIHFNGGVVDEHEIANYASNREQFCIKAKSSDNKVAISQMNENISTHRFVQFILFGSNSNRVSVLIASNIYYFNQ